MIRDMMTSPPPPHTHTHTHTPQAHERCDRLLYSLLLHEALAPQRAADDFRSNLAYQSAPCPSPYSKHP